MLTPPKTLTPVVEFQVGDYVRSEISGRAYKVAEVLDNECMLSSPHYSRNQRIKKECITLLLKAGEMEFLNPVKEPATQSIEDADFERLTRKMEDAKVVAEAAVAYQHEMRSKYQSAVTMLGLAQSDRDRNKK
jgi:hypothetical protein